MKNKFLNAIVCKTVKVYYEIEEQVFNCICIYLSVFITIEFFKNVFLIINKKVQRFTVVPTEH